MSMLLFNSKRELGNPFSRLYKINIFLTLLIRDFLYFLYTHLYEYVCIYICRNIPAYIQEDTCESKNRTIIV